MWCLRMDSNYHWFKAVNSRLYGRRVGFQACNPLVDRRASWSSASTASCSAKHANVVFLPPNLFLDLPEAIQLVTHGDDPAVADRAITCAIAALIRFRPASSSR